MYICVKIQKVIFMKFTDIDSAINALNSGENIEFENKTLILASGSASRFKIMKNANMNFITIPSNADEENIKKNFGVVNSEKLACEYVKVLACEKGRWLKVRVKNAVILAADTIAFYKDEILEKPKDEKDARRIFNALSDSVHVAITGVCIIDGEKEDNFAVVSDVKMLKIEEELQDILVKDKLTYTYAGGYCVDGNLGDKVIVDDKDFNNVMGLPIEKIKKKLQEAGYDFSK